MHSIFWTVFPYLLLAAIVGFAAGVFVRAPRKRSIGEARAGVDTRELEQKVEALQLQLESVETSIERLAMLEDLLQRVSLLDEHQKERAGALERRLAALDDLSQKLSAVKDTGARMSNVQSILGRLEDHLRARQESPSPSPRGKNPSHQE
ncbi:MAG: hypothetical protein U0174_06355 [Polyangiaceae bacterium]